MFHQVSYIHFTVQNGNFHACTSFSFSHTDSSVIPGYNYLNILEPLNSFSSIRPPFFLLLSNGWRVTKSLVKFFPPTHSWNKPNSRSYGLPFRSVLCCRSLSYCFLFSWTTRSSTAPAYSLRLRAGSCYIQVFFSTAFPLTSVLFVTLALSIVTFSFLEVSFQ